MKKHNIAFNTYNKRMYALIALLLCLFFVLVLQMFSGVIFAENNDINKEIVFQKNINPLNIYKIIDDNVGENIKQEMIVEEIDMEYITKYQNNAELPNGVVQVLQEGRVGKKTSTIIRKYIDNEIVSEEQVSEKIMKSPVDRIVEIGTGSGRVTKASVGDTIFVVPISVAVRLEPNENSEKICTLNKKESAQIIKIEGDWYFISNLEIKGYVPKDCFTTQNPEQPQEYIYDSLYTKQQLLAKLNYNMNLNTPSGLSLDQFKKVLSGNSNDKNKIFEKNAEYFYYVEKQYNVNGIFIAAVGIHESAWGTSAIANNKKNLFGYGAIDSNPYGGAYSFDDYSEGIDLLARVFVKYYLNPPGTIIYDGTKTDGKFYNGSNLSSVNIRYASDKKWSNGVYSWMQYLYNRL